jgi:hypothetical protein
MRWVRILLFVSVMASVRAWADPYGTQTIVDHNAVMGGGVSVEAPFGPVTQAGRPISGTDVNVVASASGVIITDPDITWVLIDLTGFEFKINGTVIPHPALNPGADGATMAVRVASTYFAAMSAVPMSLHAKWHLWGFDENLNPVEADFEVNPSISAQAYNRITMSGTKYDTNGNDSSLYSLHTGVAVNGAKLRFGEMNHQILPPPGIDYLRKAEFLADLFSPAIGQGQAKSATAYYGMVHGEFTGIKEGNRTNPPPNPVLTSAWAEIKAKVAAAVLGPYALPRPNIALFYSCDVLNPNNGVQGDPRNTFKMTPDPGEPDYSRDKAVAGFETPVGTALKIGDRGPVMSDELDGFLYQHSVYLLDKIKVGTFLQDAVSDVNDAYPPRAPIPPSPNNQPVNVPQVDMKLAPASSPFDVRTRLKWVYLKDLDEATDMAAQQGTIDNWWYRTEWSNN